MTLLKEVEVFSVCLSIYIYIFFAFVNYCCLCFDYYIHDLDLFMFTLFRPAVLKKICMCVSVYLWGIFMANLVPPSSFHRYIFNMYFMWGTTTFLYINH